MQFELALGPIRTAAEEEEHRRLELLPSEPANLYARAWEILQAYHAAVMRADPAAVEQHRLEMEDVACRLNGGTNFASACEGGGDWQLRRELAAPAGQVPMHGQPGQFVIVAAGCRVLVKSTYVCARFDGGFEIHAIDADRPFPSSTGFRSFISARFERERYGLTFAEFVRHAIEAHVAGALKGRLETLEKPERLAAEIAADPDRLPGSWLAEALARLPLPPLPTPPAPTTRQPRRRKAARAHHHAV